MHLVEQLQAKRTEATNRLLSRKRKLSELFAATACTGDFFDAATNQQYFQQLQAFHDANDLQKNRLFNELTLPPRPPIHRVIRDDPIKPTNNGNLKTTEDGRRSKSPAQNNVRAPSTSLEIEPGKQNNAIASPELQATAHGQSKSTGEFEVLDNHATSTNGQSSSLQDDSSPKTSPTLRPDKSQPMRPQAEPTKDPPVATVEKDQPNGEVAAPVLTNGVDAHSSPASSNRPGSNTPAPTAGSPTTSPGEEDAPLALKPVNEDGGADAIDTVILPATLNTESSKPKHKMSVSSVDIDMMDADSVIVFESSVKASNQPLQTSKDSSNRKPSIRINTESSSSKSPVLADGAIVETPGPMTGTEMPRQPPMSTPVSAVDPTRRATRISSGALQKKSVSEILGETPKSTSPHVDSPISSSAREAFASSSAQGRQADRERKEKERTKLSTVVFAKPQRPSDVDPMEVAGNGNYDLERTKPEDRDYLYTLFESKAYSSKQGNLTHLIQHAHKIITTTDHLVDYEYQAQCRVLKRLYQLQSADRWALRQRKRADEPPRPTSHWDFLLDHAKWMRTDFREERKWKYAAARALAECCAEWVACDPEERKLLQVQVRKPGSRPRRASTDQGMTENASLAPSSHPTPELLASGEDESVSDDIADPRDLSLTSVPAAIFSLGAGEFNFVADKTPAFDKLINELPLYEPATIEPDLSKSNLGEKLDARWKTDIVPVSRFAVEKLIVKDERAPVRRSRYDYDLETSSGMTEILPPRDANVGLFMADNKHIRDRIHPGHSFRPPSEHPMPTQSFFETRSSSQWTPAEDDELRKLVKDYSYNWSLISSCLTPRCLYSSSPDRRTPWECFERWIGLEGMPADMAKTPYFRTYSGRIEAAGRHVQAQIEEAQRRAGPTVPIPNRKRTTQPVRVERKRASRHLAMLDAMRKLAKKREVHRQKQAHSADVAAMRKSNEVNQPRLGAKTPAEWSQLKYEREQKLAKQQELYRQQLIAHQRAATAQQQRAPNGTANPVPNGMTQPSNAGRGPPNGTPAPGMPNGQMGAPNGVPRPTHPSMMGVPSGMPVANGMAGPKGLPAQMQANMRNGMGNSPQQMRMHQEQLMRQAQQNGTQTSPNGNNASMANGSGMNNPALMAAMVGANGAPSPSAGMGGNSGSPRSGGMGQALSSGHVPVLAQIAATIKERHPNMTDEDIQRLATQQLTSWQQQATAAAAGQPRPRVNQAALNAAMGAANAAANAGMAAAAANGGFSGMTNDQIQQYQQRMRMQQAQQHAARGMQGQMPPGMMGQMNNSPVMNMARPVSQHNNQGLSRSATPRDQRSGSISNVSVTSNGNANVNGGQNQGQGQQVQSGPQSSPRVNPAQPMQT